jgi:hypothetical protein
MKTDDLVTHLDKEFERYKNHGLLPIAVKY